MSGTNCPFETRFGRVTGDYDLPVADEETQDGGPSVLGGESVLMVQRHLNVVTVVNKADGEYDSQRHIWPGVLGSRFTDRGLVGVVATGGGGSDRRGL